MARLPHRGARGGRRHRVVRERPRGVASRLEPPEIGPIASLEVLLSFLAATAIFAYVPGPGLLYTAAQTLARGRRAGLLAALGLHLGGYVHVAAASAGLTILLSTVPVAYTVLKVAGAIYLIWLGISLWRSARAAANVPDFKGAPATASAGNPLWQSAVVEICNPKTALFFLAFLPQFADPAGALPVPVQLLVLGTIVNLMFSSADLLCVGLADRIAGRLRGNQQRLQLLQRLGGGLLVGLGLRLGLG